jgi:hypothetical protein
MRYRLRTLLILLAVMPPLLAWGWLACSKWRAERERAIGVSLNDWGCVRPPRFPLTPEDQAAVEAWITSQPGNPGEK